MGMLEFNNHDFQKETTLQMFATPGVVHKLCSYNPKGTKNTGISAERYILKLLEPTYGIGEIMGGANDKGIDIIFPMDVYVQVKCIKGKVTPKMIRELAGSDHVHNKTTTKIYVGFGGFTKMAADAAKNLSIMTIDINNIFSMAQKHQIGVTMDNGSAYIDDRFWQKIHRPDIFMV
jgi:hypothetical protein